jgi:hypothetical protein
LNIFPPDFATFSGSFASDFLQATAPYLLALPHIHDRETIDFLRKSSALVKNAQDAMRALSSLDFRNPEAGNEAIDEVDEDLQELGAFLRTKPTQKKKGRKLKKAEQTPAIDREAILRLGMDVPADRETAAQSIQMIMDDLKSVLQVMLVVTMLYMSYSSSSVELSHTPEIPSATALYLRPICSH